MTENVFASFALMSWFIVALWLYSSRSIAKATLWTILGGQLLLPVGALIKVAPGIPQLDKTSIPNLAALIGCLLTTRRVRFWNGIGVAEALLFLSLLGPFLTSQLNGDVISVGGRILPSVSNYDALSAVVAQFLLLIPFFLGRQFLRTGEATREILRALCISGLLYSPLILLEIRLSPQVHYWVYGYYPSEFLQQMRGEGFRAMVFMGHGLALSFFMMTTVLAAAALWRAGEKIWDFSFGVAGYLYALVLLNKSLGSLIYASVAGPLVRYASARTQYVLAVCLVLVALLYPTTRILDLFPTGALLEGASYISAERAASLEFRFNNEDRLLERASERILFGWGRFGRSRVYNEHGSDISVTDGRWIITLGQFGAVGFVGEFGLLALSVVAAAVATRRLAQNTDVLFVAALALIVAINTVDLLPNSWLTPWTWLLAGSLLGRAEDIRRARSTTMSSVQPEAQSGAHNI